MSEGLTMLIESLERDMIGPHGGADEEIKARPSDQYLTGMLYPRRQEESVRIEDDEDRDVADDEESAARGTAIAMGSMGRPPTAGVSFSVDGQQPRLVIAGTAGRYSPREAEENSKLWKRRTVDLQAEFPLIEGLHPHAGPEGLTWWIRGVRSGASWQATVV